jgi:UDP-glucuronate 4-epimerase
MKRTLITGSAGFIGSELTQQLLNRGTTVIGVDNHNSYYDPLIKEARLARYAKHPNYVHLRIDLANKEAIDNAFSTFRPQHVINLAAQAGVRNSIKDPHSYVNSNIIGFLNILEGCRHHNVEHLVYASSSSVYGANTKTPFSVHDSVDHPLNIYAASKKANELMAHSYSHLYQLPTTGLRFFTVYGPWGRPDMALFKFTKSILAGEPIEVYNFGKQSRDFTYIDDIVNGIIKVLETPAEPNLEWSGKTPDACSSKSPWRVYNIGNNDPIDLMQFIAVLELELGIKANIKLSSPQTSEVQNTHADISELIEQFNYRPSTSISEGVKRFIVWYRAYYKV